jgi:UDP-N-acetylmuramate dehydrogenase
MDAAGRTALRTLLEDRVEFDAPMARHTSLRVGGPVDALATPADRTELASLLSLAKQRGWPHVVVGAGFNTVVRDGGLSGLAIRLTRFRVLEIRPGPRVFAEAGVSHASLSRRCAREGVAGLAFGAGIPGTIGGWIAMNAGIGTHEVKDVIERVELLVPGEDTPREIDAADLEFRYRELRGVPPGSVLLSGTFRATASTPEAVQAEIDALLARRAATQPLDVPSCGSVFKNPPGDFAGRLIEAAGLKGAREGGAEISTTHANFIVNRGGARACDVLALIDRARERVAQATGIALETEVRLLGRNAS